MINKILAVAGVLALIGGGVLFGKWLEKPTLDDLAYRNRVLAAASETLEVELEEGRVAYNRLVRDYNNAEQAWAYVNDSLNNVAKALKIQAQKDGRTIETLTTANARLRDSLDVMVSNINITDSVITAELYTYKSYQDGDIGAEGYVSIWTPEDDEPYANAGLTFDIRMQPTVLISRDEDTGLAECDLSFGDMPVYVRDLECVNNWDVDLPTRSEITLPGILTGSAITLGAIGILALIFN